MSFLRVGVVKSSRVNETHYGSGDEASSYTDADVLDIPLPEHTYQRPHPPPSTHTHCNTGYFGLPYQDHNYGMLPPPSPTRPVSPRPSSPLQDYGVVQMEEEVKTTPFISSVEEVVEDSVTRCICGYLHDDGYMICCDQCSVWQHIDCMGVDRNNIPESYFCELCQPRTLDPLKAKMLQKRKREELAARNVLSDSSATDTDPEEAANALASMGKKLPTCKKKSPKHKRSLKVKDKQMPLKLKIGKGICHKKVKRPGKKEKENIKSVKPRKMFKTGSQKLKAGKSKNRPLLTLEQLSADPWNSNLSPWVDSYEFAHENQYSPAVREFSSNSHLIGQSVDISSIVLDQLLTQATCVTDVKKNRKGLKATQDIPARQAIIEYKGRVVLRHDYDKEHAFINSFKKLQPFVLFYSKLDIDLCVDARVYGNEARFLRRSCSPNSEVQHILSQGKMYFVIVSKKDIIAGSEITIPFDYNYENCSYCVECACTKSNCVVSKYWKRLKNIQKSSLSDINMKRKRQPSGREGIKVNVDDRFNSSSSQGSPNKASLSPVRSLQMKLSTATSPHPPLSSPIKLSNVCTLLAASALLDGQPDIVTSLQLEVSEPLPQAPPPTLPPKSATSSRRGSRVSEDSIKEEKPVLPPVVPLKEKHKTKEVKPKEKENKDGHHHHPPEVKKERRPSSRRQSQEELEETTEIKTETATLAGGESDEGHTSSECPRKLTREERKLDAIMKAFEKMEKREERRKEAMARGDCGPKKCQGEIKFKKKHETDGNSTCGSNPNSRSTSQDGPAEGGEDVKAEPASDDHQEAAPPPASAEGDIKPENASAVSPESGSKPCLGPVLSSVTSPIVPETPVPVKEESPHKPVRRSDKRKRRKSRVQSTTAISDAASISTDEGNSNSSFPIGPLSVPTTPAHTPLSTPLPHVDVESGMFKYIKTKKHLFEEWSHKQEDENSKHEAEIFVQCLPNPHVNTMDHLQRRHSHSINCSSRTTESSAGSAKKRWLRQAMHEVPTPVAFNHSLSVSTDSGGGSPVHCAASPRPGTCLASPGTSSPLDFVTPLKKRRLMRESVSSETSNGPTASASSRVLTDSFTTNNLGFTTKTNGVKQFYPAHRHSTDDRLLLHKNYPYQNGFKEVVTLTDESISASNTDLNNLSNSHDVCELDMHHTDPEERLHLEPVAAADQGALPNVGCLSEAMPMAPVTLLQSKSQYSIKFKGIFERMEVDSSNETFQGSKVQPEKSSSRMEESLPNPSLHEFEEDSRIDSSAPANAIVVVNSSVYTGVNNLIDEGSEAGYVTAKSIMNVDSPATVRIDLDAHDMEPSLSDGSGVVTFDDRLFNRSARDMRTFEMPNECQVNSSVDLVDTLPLSTGGPRNEICDNACMDFTSGAQVAFVGIPNHAEERTTHSSDLEEDQEVVDSSQHVNNHNSEEPTAVFETQNIGILPNEDQPGTSAGLKTFAECISSSSNGHMSSCIHEPVSDGPKVVCDSVEEFSESLSEYKSGRRHCEADGALAQRPGYGESSDDHEGVQSCDSVGGNAAVLQLPTQELTVEGGTGDNAVSESHCIDNHFFLSASDGNVDSTSSETSRGISQLSMYDSARSREGEPVTAADGCCDSNYERLPSSDSIYDSSVTGDESSLEGLCVSSSNVMDLQSSSSSWECYTKETFSVETLPDHSVSTPALDYNSAISQSSSSAVRSGIPRTVLEQPEHSMDVGQSPGVLANSATDFTTNCTTISCSFQSFSSQPVFLSPTSLSSSSPAVSTECSNNSSYASPPSGQQIGTVSGTPTSQTITSSPPILSTADTTPAVKKKVSLLEYRKRLKEKPVVSSVSESKTSSSVAPSSTSSSAHHLKLSPTLSLFLASSPTTSSSSSVSPSKSPSSSNHNQKKHKMPTLATLPLFKDADAKKEENKKKQKPKPEKPLSLNERLRLEFGLDDCGEDAGKNKKDDCKKHRGPVSPASPPPPPPPHPPPLLPAGTTSSPYHHNHPVSRHNKDGDETEVASSNGCIEDSVPPPPPPPPTVGSSYPPPAAATAGFTTPSAHLRTGYHGSQGPLVNGGSGPYYNYQQQPGISSTMSIPPSTLGNGGKDRHVPRFSGNSGVTGSAPNLPSGAPYPPHHQQQPSSASHLNPSSSHSQTWPTESHSQTWTVNQGGMPPPLTLPPPPPTNIHHVHPSPQSYDFNHWQPTQSQTVINENIVTEDPPPPPPRVHHQPAQVSSSSSSSQHKHHHHHSSSGKSKNSKAAPLSSTSSSSHYSDNRSRH